MKCLNRPFPRAVSRNLFAAFCAALTALGCSPAPAPQKPAPTPIAVSLIVAQPTQVPLTLEVVGQTEGPRDAEVRARVGGILQKRLYQEGEPVKAGQPLFQIDPVPYEIALNQAKAMQAEQKARLDQAQREAARLKGLLAQNAVSQKEYDDAASSEGILKADVQSAEAGVRQAELNLSYARVTAPVAGISGRAQRSEGSLVSVGSDSLLTNIVQIDPLWARFSVSEDELAQLRSTKALASSRIEAVLLDGTVYPLPGRLNFAATRVDPKLSTVELRAEFKNADGILLPGQFVRIRIISGAREAFLIPQTAVSQGDQGKFVYVVGPDNAAQIRPIKTEGSEGKNWVVVAGLKPGDQLVADNLLKIRPGSPLKPDVATAPSAAPPAKP
jgi:membrane fusion protein (multidrug efflux system)